MNAPGLRVAAGLHIPRAMQVELARVTLTRSSTWDWLGCRNSAWASAKRPCGVMASAEMSSEGKRGRFSVSARVRFFTASSMFRKPFVREGVIRLGPSARHEKASGSTCKH